jgi:hypothetical protein
MEWPGRCRLCKQPIEDWGDAGYHRGRWLHKACWTESLLKAGNVQGDLPALESPLERRRELELPMLIYMLLFHFGLGAAVAGWILFAQGYDEATGIIVFPAGLIAGLIGVAGAAVNIVSRRRIELIRQELETQGGWKPGR